MKKWLSFVLALALMLSLLPGLWTLTASAADDGEFSLQHSHINPLYADSVSREDLKESSHRVLYAGGDEAEYATSVEDAGAVMRQAMKQRRSEFAVRLKIENDSDQALIDLAADISAEAMKHTGEPTEGDYLMWQYAGWNAQIGGSRENGVAYATYSYVVTYYTYEEQEALVDAEVEQLLKQLNVGGEEDINKIHAIYDYICANVVYDYEHVNNSDYKTQFTAYGALIDGTSVCQGYAVLFYRLALELGVDARLIPGFGGGEPHGWNIVRLGNLYYNVDSTWDAGRTNYSYFLKCDADFDDHTREPEYATDSFYADYPMSQTNYSTCSHSYDAGKVTREATCTEAGTRTYTCSSCGDIRTEEIKALGHSWNSQVTKPTCTAEGYTTHSCANCGDTYTDAPTEKLSHDYVNGKCTVCGAVGTARISGNSRFETSLLIADALKQELGAARFDTIVVASGENFADALAGSYLAGKTNAPILLADIRNPETVKTYIRENLVPGGKVYLLGGENSLPAALETGLADYSVVRLAGSDRFATNLQILQETGARNQEFLVCTGDGFADSLSASAACKPILLVGRKLSNAQKEFLAASGGSFTIIGGENSVSAAVAQELKAYGTVERIGGASRYETSILIAKRYFTQPQAVVLASALSFPDGLCGGPLAFHMGAPLILTAEKNESAAADYVAQQGIAQGVVLGGTASISDKTAEIILK